MSSPKETLVKIAADYYLWIHHHGPVRQDNLFRTYLWMASLILALAGSLLKSATPDPISYPSFFLGYSILFSGITVVYCLHHMRGKIQVSYPRLDKYAQRIDGTDDEKELNWMIEQYWEATRPGKEQMAQRTRSLRVTTWLLSFSFVMLAAAGILSAPKFYSTSSHKGGDVIVAEEKPLEEPSKQPERKTPVQERSTPPSLDLDHATNREDKPSPELGVQRTKTTW